MGIGQKCIMGQLKIHIVSEKEEVRMGAVHSVGPHQVDLQFLQCFLNHLDQVTLGNSLELHVEHPIKPFRPWLYPVDAAYLTQGRPNAYGSRLRYSF